MSIKKNAKTNAGMKQDSATQQSGCHKMHMSLSDNDKKHKKLLEDFIFKYGKIKVKLSNTDYRRARFELNMINLFSILEKLKEIKGDDINGKHTRRNAKGN